MDPDRGGPPSGKEAPPVLDPLIDLANALRRRAITAPGDEREARAESLRSHVEEYLIPRATDAAGPLLVVIMGSTGAGKSSLLNALAGGPVSPSGVLRPTTRQPVAVVHPEDAGGRFGQIAERADLDVRLDAFARRGLVLVDSPDFDSAEGANRDAARHLLAVADLVIFVTTATRYADQAPWEVVGRARARGLPFRAVLNRLPAEEAAADAVLDDFRDLLERAGANRNADVVPIREGALDRERDALAADAIEPLRDALDALVASEYDRREVARRGLVAAMHGLPLAVEVIAREIDEEQKAVADLRTTADTAFAERRETLDDELGRGVFLRAEVLRQWQDFVGAGQVARFLSDGIGKVVASVRSVFESPARAPAAEVRDAAFADLVALVVQHADTAAQRTASAWSVDRYGALALAGDDALWRASDGLPERLTSELDGWAAGIGERIRELGAQRKGWATAASLGVNAIGTSAVLAVFVHTGGLTGTEVGITAATAVVNQKLLEAIFGEANVAAFVARARSDLRELLDRTFVDERTRFEAALGSTGDPALARRLREAAARVDAAAEPIGATPANAEAGEGGTTAESVSDVG
jgi:energy-coupling factor transporter ATP-binding protein EcfA2